MMPAASPPAATDRPLSLGWSFTVVHHDRLDAGAATVMREIDAIARQSEHFFDSHGQRDRVSWEFSAADLPVLEAMHGIALHRAPHWWAVQTTVGDRS